jgi:SAM-dependent methyltransferase
MTMDESREQNLKSWESRVGVHATSKMYDLDGIVSGAKQYSDIFAFDVEPLGDVSGLDAVHLQCHIGTDTVSLARTGARVTGLDFSPAALEVGRDLADRCGLDVRFVESELYGAVDVLGREQFDLVYTGVGALGWLPDIKGWARVVADLLRPGGRLYLREGHPVLWTLDPERTDQLLVLGYPYFETEEPEIFEFAGTYTDGDASHVVATTHEWNHGLGEIVQAVLDAGLTLTRLVEHDFAEWKALDWMAVDDKGHWRLPEHRERLPVMYTLEARKPR